MSMNYTDHFKNSAKSPTPQTEKMPGKNQVKNNAGGYVFTVGPMDQLKRFLILGSEGGTYYVGEKALTIESAKNVIACIKQNGSEVVQTIVDISHGGRAPKNDPAIFALALAATYGDEATKKAAYDAVTKVCRIGTHLFQFTQAVQDLRQWSRGLRSAVARFYTERSTDAVAMQLVKYRQRDGWTHKDVLRLAYPKAQNAQVNELFRYTVGKSAEVNHPLVVAFEEIQAICKDPAHKVTKADVKKAVALITEYGLPREALPTQFLSELPVWEALLAEMPPTALIRNLGKMTNIGLLKSGLDSNVKKVIATLTDPEALKKARVHPLAILVALKTYQAGHGDKGSLSWSPVQRIVDGLDEAFYLAFDAVEPTYMNTMLALDVSGSMGGARIAGMPLMAREATAAMAMLVARTEPNHEFFGFSNTFMKLKISKSMRMDAVLREISNLPFQGTDCSLPMQYALKNKLEVDVFQIYTDNETYAGSMHPKQALDEFRKKMGINAKVAVIATSATNFTIADPSDPGMIDVAGFDAAVPEVLANFARGW